MGQQTELKEPIHTWQVTEASGRQHHGQPALSRDISLSCDRKVETWSGVPGTERGESVRKRGVCSEAGLIHVLALLVYGRENVAGSLYGRQRMVGEGWSREHGNGKDWYDRQP